MVLLYIDPGTGSMLFTILIGLLSAAVYFFRSLWMKIKMGTGSSKHADEEDRVPYLIYSEGSRYFSVFRPVLDELEKEGIETTFWTSSENDPVFQQEYKHIHAEYIGEGNRAFSRLNFAKADILLATTPGLEVYQWKRSKDVKWYVHLPHAASDINCYRMFGIDYYDAILLSGEYQKEQVRELERLRNLPEKELELVGIPYMDVMAERLKNAVPLPESDTKTILIGPSWGKSAILSRYGGRIIDALLEQTNYRIIVRPHPQSFISEKELMDKLMAEYPESDRLSWNRDADNFDVLRSADLLISDFSGVIFDFTLIYDKPVVYADTSYDKSPYDCCWSEDEIWTLRTLPKLGKQLREEDLTDIQAVIDECLNNPAYAVGRHEAKEETWVHPGEGAVRVAEYLKKKEKELTDVQG